MPPRIPEPPLEQAHIRQLIPHAGRMCLLERATFWDETRIRCEATSHLDPGNPMRGEGGLRAVTGIEYAAQAIALHGALLHGGDPGRPGYLVSLRDVSCRVPALDTAMGRLDIEVERLMSDGANAIYAFAVRADDKELLCGRATVVLSASGQGG